MKKKESTVEKKVKKTVVDVAAGIGSVKTKVSKKTNDLGEGASNLIRRGAGAVKDAVKGLKKGIKEVRGKKNQSN